MHRTRLVTLLAGAFFLSLLIQPALAQEGPQTKGFVYTSQFQKKPPYKIGLSNFSVGNSWRVQMVEEAKWEAEQNSDLIEDLIVTNAQGNISKQISDIEDMITQGVDAIILSAISPKALIPVVERARENGIVVVDYDNLIQGEHTTASVIVDQKSFGRVGAEFLVEELNGSGKIVVFNGIKGTSISQERWQGAKAVFDKHPDMKVLQKVYADWSYSKAKSAAEDLLASYPEIDGVWSQGGAMTQAAIDAFNEHGRTLVPMFGEDNNGFLKAWKKNKGKGNFTAISASMPTYVSAIAMDVAVNALRGFPYYRDTVVPIPTITSDEIDQYVRPELPDSFWTNSRLPEKRIKEMFER